VVVALGDVVVLVGARAGVRAFLVGGLGVLVLELAAVDRGRLLAVGRGGRRLRRLRRDRRGRDLDAVVAAGGCRFSPAEGTGLVLGVAVGAAGAADELLGLGLGGFGSPVLREDEDGRREREEHDRGGAELH